MAVTSLDIDPISLAKVKEILGNPKMSNREVVDSALKRIIAVAEHRTALIELSDLEFDPQHASHDLVDYEL